MSCDLQNLETMRRELDPELVAKVQALARTADKVLLAGEAGTSHLYAGFALRLQMLGINA
jgi:DNA-binding MurR/RpiR family transcriptional regulator